MNLNNHKAPNDCPAFMKLADAARYSCCTKKQLLLAVDTGQLKAIRFRGATAASRLRFVRDDIDEFLGKPNEDGS